MTRWVVLRRFDGGGHLKCLDCGWKWKSKRKYVRLLPDWTEESRTGMTDADILRRLRAGNLRINPVTSAVESNMKGDWRTIKQIASQHGEDGYRFVSICYAGKKKKIAVHRLQWMAYTDALVPDGYDVHHKKSPPRPAEKPNCVSNLELRESMENQCEGCSPGWDDDVPF